MTENSSGIGQIFVEGFRAINNLLFANHRELITVLRTPTPVKIARSVQADDHGCIGSGLDAPNPREIWRCPMSTEAWLHRITITSPDYTPNNPLTEGQLLFTGGTGQVIIFTPQPPETNVLPAQFVEGHLSAPHLSSGETLLLVGDQLPADLLLRVDLQVLLNTGISEFTPRQSSPTNINAKDAEPILS